MTTDIEHILPGFRTIDGELINSMIDAIEASGVSTVSVVTANGVSGSVANPTTTPAITLTLGAITPSSVAAVGTVTGSNLSGTNTGDQTILLTGDVTGGGTGSFTTTIASGAVSLAKMASLAANSIIGNNTGSPATPIALTAAQTKTLLSLNLVENTALSTWAGSTSLTTLGTIATGTWGASTIPVNKGGSGQTSYTDGQLLIGNSSGNTLSKATLTAGANITITNGNGTIQIAASAPGTGTVTSVSVTTANGVSGSVANATTTPAITLTLGAITPTTVAPTDDITIANGKAIKTDTTTAHTALIQAYDVDNTTYRTFGTLTNGNTPSLALSQPSGGTLTWDGGTIGATTPVQIQGYRPTNTQTGTTYTLVLGDAGYLVTLSNGSAITLTVPTNASVAFAVGTEIDLAQLGAGQVTVAAAGGVTINSYGGNLKLTGQYAGATLKKTATDTWLLIGNLSA